MAGFCPSHSDGDMVADSHPRVNLTDYETRSAHDPLDTASAAEMLS
jgi:hypothetical protein